MSQEVRHSERVLLCFTVLRVELGLRASRASLPAVQSSVMKLRPKNHARYEVLLTVTSVNVLELEPLETRESNGISLYAQHTETQSFPKACCEVFLEGT